MLRFRNDCTDHARRACILQYGRASRERRSRRANVIDQQYRFTLDVSRGRELKAVRRILFPLSRAQLLLLMRKNPSPDRTLQWALQLVSQEDRQLLSMIVSHCLYRRTTSGNEGHHVDFRGITLLRNRSEQFLGQKAKNVAVIIILTTQDQCSRRRFPLWAIGPQMQKRVTAALAQCHRNATALRIDLTARRARFCQLRAPAIHTIRAKHAG